jgi:hypothetical protein
MSAFSQYTDSQCTHDGTGLYSKALPQLTTADVGIWYARTVANGNVLAGTPDYSFQVQPFVA